MDVLSCLVSPSLGLFFLVLAGKRTTKLLPFPRFGEFNVKIVSPPMGKKEETQS